MKNKTLALALASAVLAACGGGGDARSPDRPALKVDPATLEIKFVKDINQLPGTGNNRISVRMLALRSDGINMNVGPKQVLTDKTSWSLEESDLGDPAIAALAENVREVAGLGKVQDILSTMRMSIDDAPVSTRITGVYKHNKVDYPIVATYTIEPPKALDDPFISGPETIVLNPLKPNDTATGKYSLLQALQGLASRENRTHTVRFCETSEYLEITEEQPRPIDDGDVDITFSNPFADGSKSQLSVDIYAVNADTTCEDPNATRYEKTINIVAGTISDVAACVVTNPADDVCEATTGDFNSAYLDSCKGLDTDSVSIPAAQNLQMAARLTYTNPRDPQQPPLDFYKCASAERLAWSAAPELIFEDAPDAANGNGSTVNRLDFDNIAAADRASTVTASYTANPEDGDDAVTIEDALTLNLVGVEVAEIRIDRVDGESGPDTIYLNVFREGIDYEAKCRFSEFGTESADFVTCPASLVAWTVAPEGIVAPTPSSGATTELKPLETPNGQGDVVLTATYNGGLNPISATRDVTTVEDSIVELRLFMQPKASSSDLAIDPFACVGRDDLVGTLSSGEITRGGQQFKAYALFASSGETTAPQGWLTAPNGVDSQLRDITDQAELRFSAVIGYWDAAQGCVTESQSPVGASDLPEQIPAVIAPAAGFNADKKGYIESRGLLRLGTVCVQAYFDPDLDGVSDGDITSLEGSTIAVLPVADDALLAEQDELCETLDPLLTAGGAGAQLLFNLGLIGDPVLATLAANEDGGALPVEDIINALITGDFTPLGGPDVENGLGTLTSTLLGANPAGS